MLNLKLDRVFLFPNKDLLLFTWFASFVEKPCSVLKICNFLHVKPFHQLQNLLVTPEVEDSSNYIWES